MVNIFLIFLFISFIINIGLFISLKKYNLFKDNPLEQPHKIHKIAAIRCGGVSIYLTFLLGFFILESNYKYTFLLSTMSFLIGFIEDIYKGIKPKIRFLALSMISIIAIYLKPDIILNDTGILKFPYYLAILVTIIAIAGFTNSINITDGLNGLASGVVLNACFFIILLSHLNKDFNTLKFLIILTGATTGFFIINFFTGKIFLGDSGAYFLGTTLAIISLKISNTYQDISPWFFLVLFAYPITDTVFAMYRRYIKGRKILYSDFMHMHTLLNKRVFRNHIKATFLIISVSFVFSVIAWKFKSNHLWLIFIYFSYVFTFIFSYFWIIKRFKR